MSALKNLIDKRYYITPGMVIDFGSVILIMGVSERPLQLRILFNTGETETAVWHTNEGPMLFINKYKEYKDALLAATPE